MTRGMFEEAFTKVLDGTEAYVETAIMIPSSVEDWQGLDAFVASITGSGTVTPTVYYHFGKGNFGPAHSLTDNTTSKNATFTVSQAFECYLRGQNHFIPCEGWKIRFSLSGHAAGDIITAAASIR